MPEDKRVKSSTLRVKMCLLEQIKKSNSLERLEAIEEEIAAALEVLCLKKINICKRMPDGTT